MREIPAQIWELPTGYSLEEMFENEFPEYWNSFFGAFVANNYLMLEKELKDKLGKLYQRL